MFPPQSRFFPTTNLRLFVTITPSIKLCLSAVPYHTISELIHQLSLQLKLHPTYHHHRITSLLLQNSYLPSNSLISQVLNHKDHITCELKRNNPMKKIKKGIRKIAKLMGRQDKRVGGGEGKRVKGWKKRKVRNEKDMSKYSSISTHESAILNC